MASDVEKVVGTEGLNFAESEAEVVTDNAAVGEPPELRHPLGVRTGAVTVGVELEVFITDSLKRVKFGGHGRQIVEELRWDNHGTINVSEGRAGSEDVLKVTRDEEVRGVMDPTLGRENRSVTRTD